MSDKRHQLSILDQWASESGQVSRSTERLQEIAGWIDWQPLYEVGRRIDKTGPQGGQPRKPVRWMIRGLFLQHLYQLSDDKRAELAEDPSAQIDTDADSTKKNGTWHFGYRGHIGVDVGSKLIRQLSFTKASPHDSTQLEELISGDERALFGDKAYASKALKIRCRQEGTLLWNPGQSLAEHPTERRPESPQPPPPAGPALRRASVCRPERALRDAGGHGQNEAAQQSPIHPGRDLLEHRA